MNQQPVLLLVTTCDVVHWRRLMTLQSGFVNACCPHELDNPESALDTRFTHKPFLAIQLLSRDRGCKSGQWDPYQQLPAINF